jgi:DinB superfamily
MLDRREEIFKTLRATPVVLRALVTEVDEARLRRRPAPGEWAIIEVVGHLADTEERALARVRRMLAEEAPELEPFDQEALPRSATTSTLTWRERWLAWIGSRPRTWPCWSGLTAPAGSGSVSHLRPTTRAPPQAHDLPDSLSCSWRVNGAPLGGSHAELSHL